MISPDVLKQSATAGFVGLAVAGGVVFATLCEDDGSGATVDMSNWTDPVRVSYESSGEKDVPPKQPSRSAAGDRQRDEEARRAALRARNRAARRALKKLQSIECRTITAAELQAEQFRLQLDRAAWEAARR